MVVYLKFLDSKILSIFLKFLDGHPKSGDGFSRVSKKFLVSGVLDTVSYFCVLCLQKLRSENMEIKKIFSVPYSKKFE